MQPFRSFQLFRTRLMLLIGLVVVPALALILYGNFELRRVERARVQERSRAAARLAATVPEGYIRNARQLMATLTQFPYLLLSTNRPFCELHFTNLRSLAPDYFNFGLVETNGFVFCTADSTNNSFNISDRPLFQRLLKSGSFSVGDYQTTQVTGTPVLAFGWPVFNTNGTLVRMFFASLKLSLLSEAIASKEIPPGSALTIIDRNNTVLAAYPQPERWVGKTFPLATVTKKVVSENETAFEINTEDGIPMLYASTPVFAEGVPALYVLVGTPLAASLAAANAVLFHNILILLAVSALVWLSLWMAAQRFFLRPMHVLTNATERLAHGDLSARCKLASGPAELIELGQAFDAMAERLQQRGAEILQLNQSLETRVRERTQQLESANKELEAFTYSVSHDLRSPLRHIRGYAEILLTDFPAALTGEAGRLLQSIHGATNKMTALVDDLLLFSKMGTGELNLSRVDLDELLDEVRDALPETKERAIEWKRHHLGEVKADRALLRQAFLNLLANAIKYTRTQERPVIEVGSRNGGDELTIYFRDNGVGFNPDYAHKLFGVFQRLHHADEFEGTGIGLANVRRIVTRHGGRTWAEGAVNRGATIYITLPSAI